MATTYSLALAALVAAAIPLGLSQVIAKTAVLRKMEGDDLFKVVYICSNQNIANQNVQKLCVSDDVMLDDDVTQTRLLMQHLKIFHWNLPSNPVDLEQREGRINRYKCLAVRESIAKRYGKMTFKADVWEEMYQAAQEGEKHEGDSDLIPFWCLGKDQPVKIERIVPKYPFSKDVAAYQRLITILSLYRLSMGQPRQEELIRSVLKSAPPAERERLKQLFINLSPFAAQREQAEEAAP